MAQAGDPKLIKATRAAHASIIDDFYPLPGGGFLVTGMGSETGGAPGRILDAQLIPGDPQARAYTSGMFDGWLYLADTAGGTVKPVFDYSTITPGAAVPGGLPQMMRLTEDGRRMIVSQYLSGKLLLFDTSNPEAPRFLSALDLGPNAGPHDMELTGDEKRLVVTDYFLNEDDFGVIHFDGDRKVHVVKVEPDRLTLDTRFQLDFNTAFPTGPARPHGIAMK